MFNKKIKIISLFIVLGAFSFLIPNLNSKTESYYFGEAINYNNQIIFGSVNLNKFELFNLKNNKIERTAVISPLRHNSEYYDLAFANEYNELFLYLVDGKYIYKYNISNLYKPNLVSKVKDNLNDWFVGLDKIDDRIVTIGKNDVKIWNNNLEIIDKYSVKNKYQHNISFSDKGNFIFNVDKDSVQVINANNRENLSTFSIIADQDNFRKIYNDEQQKKIYIVDDQMFKLFNFDGTFINGFKHDSSNGYDVVGFDEKDYIYFSDGLGIVKIDKYTMKPIDWAYSSNLGSQGGWAQGIQVVNSNEGDKIIVFNTSSILVLNENLDLIDYYKATEENQKPIEDLWLSLDKSKATPGEYVLLKGGGYGMGEEMEIIFGKNKFKLKAEANGRFQKIIQVPSTFPTKTDIKVIGKYSKLNYSISFEIE